MSSPPRVKSGPQKAMERLGLVRDIDLALHLPMRYEDETRLLPIGNLNEGEMAQVQGLVRDCRIETRSRRQLVVVLADDSGELVLRFLNFYPANQKTLGVGQRIRARGEVRGGFLGREMVHPTFKAVGEDEPLPQSLTPVYPSSAQLPQAYLRKVVQSALGRAPLGELLPPALLLSGLPPLPSLRDALQALHRPAPDVPPESLEDHSHPAWQRLKFDELLAQQLSQAQAQAARAQLAAPVLSAPMLPAPVLSALPRQGLRVGQGGHAGQDSSLPQRLLAALPFALTPAQARVVAEIAADLARPQPMHRLLQGDVGSGKTVVAALAAAAAMGAGWQCALMAPTEILAEQHFRKLVGWLQPLGITVAWLTGSRKGKARQVQMAQVASGQALLVVGTHAVIQSNVLFARLGLAIVDEQHRFGVAQRLALRAKLGTPAAPAEPAAPNAPAAPDTAPPGQRLEPHLLMMSATPIPRTLAMSYSLTFKNHLTPI